MKQQQIKYFRNVAEEQPVQQTKEGEFVYLGENPVAKGWSGKFVGYNTESVNEPLADYSFARDFEGFTNSHYWMEKQQWEARFGPLNLAPEERELRKIEEQIKNLQSRKEKLEKELAKVNYQLPPINEARGKEIAPGKIIAHSFGTLCRSEDNKPNACYYLGADLSLRWKIQLVGINKDIQVLVPDLD